MSIKKFLKKFVKVKKEKVLIPCLEGNLLNDRCALITGGSSGIGYCIAQSFLKNGASIIITGRDEKKLEESRKKLLDSCKVEEEKVSTGVLDLLDINNLNKSFDKISKDKKIDIFVNNAGTNGGDIFPETSESDFDKVMNTNIKGMYFFSQIITKYMIKNNIKGNILNITSSSALRPGISPYILSKWGERSLTLGMAKKYLSHGIIVNGLAPGNTSTPMINKSDINDLSCDYSLTKRLIAPEEIGNIAVVLVSDMGKMIIGDTIYMTGGSGVITFDDMKY